MPYFPVIFFQVLPLLSSPVLSFPFLSFTSMSWNVFFSPVFTFSSGVFLCLSFSFLALLYCPVFPFPSLLCLPLLNCPVIQFPRPCRLVLSIPSPLLSSPHLSCALPILPAPTTDPLNSVDVIFGAVHCADEYVCVREKKRHGGLTCAQQSAISVRWKWHYSAIPHFITLFPRYFIICSPSSPLPHPSHPLIKKHHLFFLWIEDISPSVSFYALSLPFASKHKSPPPPILFCNSIMEAGSREVSDGVLEENALNSSRQTSALPL